MVSRFRVDYRRIVLGKTLRRPEFGDGQKRLATDAPVQWQSAHFREAQQLIVIKVARDDDRAEFQGKTWLNEN